MAWENSNRRDELPADWQQRRAAVEARAGGRCEARRRDGSRCWDKGTDCDHKDRGNNHDLDNLQWLCTWHHARKSSAEGNATRRRETNKRPAERHPGLV